MFGEVTMTIKFKGSQEWGWALLKLTDVQLMKC